MRALVAAVRAAAPQLPIAIKVPYLEDEVAIRSLVEAAHSSQVDAVTCCNSLPVAVSTVSTSPAPWVCRNITLSGR